ITGNQSGGAVLLVDSGRLKRSSPKGRHPMIRSRFWLAAVACFVCGVAVGVWANHVGSPIRALAADEQAAKAVPARLVPPEDGKLRIICFGAHPDDCELQAGGAAAMWAAKGHHVKFVSVTNGDIGHWREAGGPLAKRRTAEVERAAKVLGIATEVL